MIDVAKDPSQVVELALDLFGNDILRLAYSYLKRREDAEDIVQETLIRLMQSANQFEKEEAMKAWLLRVAANLCKDQIKSHEHKKQVALPEGYDVAGEEEVEYEEESEVMSAVMSLPEKYRSVIHLYYVEEYSTIEIAEILDKKESTVRSLLKRGREKLAKLISPENMMKGDSGYAE